MNETVQKVKSYIVKKELIQPGSTVVVGLSGGADSVCLLMILNTLSRELSFKLKAVHVHHGIRGQEADEDQAFSEALCRRLSIPFMTFKRDIPQLAAESHESEEECGRRIRYEILKECAKAEENGLIAVAHHMDDQAETVIFRLLRGSGVKGLAAMMAQNGNIIRPLLCIDKHQIQSYLEEIGQDYRLDCTNEDTTYSRNFLRKEILPLFSQINSNSVNHIVSLAEEAGEIEDYMDSQAEKLLEDAICEDDKDSTDGKKYKTEIINQAPSILRTIAIRKIIRDAGISLKDVHRDHIYQIENIMTKTEAGEVFLPGGIQLRCEAGKLSIVSENEKPDDFYVEITGPGEYIIKDLGVIKTRILDDFDRSLIPDSPYTKWFDYDKIKDGLCVRTRKSGDYLFVNQEGSRKSLKDYMINEKIPKSERDGVPVVASLSHVYWVVGYRICAKAKITDNTNRVLEMIFEKENKND